MSFYIKWITEFSEASTYDLLNLLKKHVCMFQLYCIRISLKIFYFLLLKPDIYEFCARLDSEGLGPWNHVSWAANLARAFRSRNLMSSYHLNGCFKQPEINMATLLPMGLKSSGLTVKKPKTKKVLTCKGLKTKENQKSKNHCSLPH